MQPNTRAKYTQIHDLAIATQIFLTEAQLTFVAFLKLEHIKNTHLKFPLWHHIPAK